MNQKHLDLASRLLRTAALHLAQHVEDGKCLDAAGEILGLLSEHYGDHGCNDWKFPANWTRPERQEFVQAVYEWNGNPEEFDPASDCQDEQDYFVMAYLAHLMRSEADRAGR